MHEDLTSMQLLLLRIHFVTDRHGILICNDWKCERLKMDIFHHKSQCIMQESTSNEMAILVWNIL